MEELLDQKQVRQDQRGNTLLTLCILSWVWIGFTAIGVAMSLYQGKLSEEELVNEKYRLLETMNEDMPPFLERVLTESIALMDKTNENFGVLMSLNLITVVVGFLGVFWMFKLKKGGFYLYLLYSLMPILVNAVFFIEFKLSQYGMIFTGFFSIIFILLYVFQLKRMS